MHNDPQCGLQRVQATGCIYLASQTLWYTIPGASAGSVQGSQLQGMTWGQCCMVSRLLLHIGLRYIGLQGLPV
jgi:hypothetical protein